MGTWTGTGGKIAHLGRGRELESSFKKNASNQ